MNFVVAAVFARRHVICGKKLRNWKVFVLICERLLIAARLYYASKRVSCRFTYCDGTGALSELVEEVLHAYECCSKQDINSAVMCEIKNGDRKQGNYLYCHS